MKFSASPDLAQRAFRAFDRLAADAPALGVAVSGGSDSTALLLLAHDWTQARGKRLAAATVDHGLRPEAAAEARQVGNLCGALGIRHDVLRWSPETRRVAQADARDARHRLLALWAAEHHLPNLALGHTRDDRIETFLLRARAGSGWHGLAAPLPASPSPAWPEGAALRLIRPLLPLSRADLRTDLAARGRGWIDDPSNWDPRHERVRARALIARLPGHAQDRIIAIADRLAVLRASVMAEARSALPDLALTDTAAMLPAASFLALSLEARTRLLEALVRSAGLSTAPLRTGPLRQLAAETCGRLNLAGAWIRLSATELAVSPEPPRRDPSREPRRDPSSRAPFMSRNRPPDWRRAHALLADPCTDVLAF